MSITCEGIFERVKAVRRRRHVARSASQAAPVDNTLSRADLCHIYGLYPFLLLAVALVTSVRMIAEPDCWFHMAFGRYVLQNHAFPPGDVFSFTGYGNEWISTGWASSLLLHILFDNYLSYGLVYFVAAVVGVIFLILYFVSVSVYANRGSAVLLLLAGGLASYLRFTPRPEVFSLLCMTAVVLLLVTAEDSARAKQGKIPWQLWGLPLVFIAWANLHGGFFIGMAPVALYCCWKAFQWWQTKSHAHLMAIAPCALCAVTWLLNPYGPDILKLVFQVMDEPNVNLRLYEYLPLYSMREMNLPWPTYVGVGLLWSLALFIFIKKAGEVPLWHVALVVMFVMMECHQRRHLGIATFGTMAVLTPHVGCLDMGRPARRVLPVAAIVGVLLIGGLKASDAMGVGGGLMQTGRDRTVLPKVAVEYLKENRPPANMFNTYGPGGYLLYFLGPETKVFIDGRFFVYEPEVWEDFLAVQDQRMTIDQLCERYGIKTFLIYIRDDIKNPKHLANRLTARPDWKLVYFSDAYAMFVHDSPETRDYIREREFRYLTPFQAERMSRALQNPATHGGVLEEVERALEISQNSAPAVALAVMAYRASGQGHKAEQLLAEALKHYPRNAVLKGLRLQR